MDEHVGYSILLKTAVWLLPVAQLPQPYAAARVKRSVCGQWEDWLNRQINEEANLHCLELSLS